MNKLILTALLLCLVGCEASVNYTSSEPENKSEFLYYNGRVALWIDPETKCEYLYQHDLVPRLDRNGKQICL